MASARTTTSAEDRVNDIVDGIVTAVEARQEARAAQLDLAAGGSAPKYSAAKHVDTLGGPLHSSDLSKLTLLATEIASSSSSSIGFHMADPEILLQLSSMLETHVNTAANVDLIREVHRVMANTETQSKKKSSALVEEVRTP
jgi:hypothetical protein